MSAAEGGEEKREEGKRKRGHGAGVLSVPRQQGKKRKGKKTPATRMPAASIRSRRGKKKKKRGGGDGCSFLAIVTPYTATRRPQAGR